jgi:U3 small nucleolar RNA-associated protein 4
MAASPLGRYLALGCEDGVVRIVDVCEGRFELLAPSRAARRQGDGSLRGIVARCDRAKTRVVSLAWGPPRRVVTQVKPTKKAKGDDSSDEESSSDDEEEDAEQWEESFLVGGTSSSLALQWDLQTGRVAARLNVERSRAEHTVVWATLALPSGVIVLADSLGKVTFYDGRTHVALPGASFANHARGADVLCLAAGPDGKSVYAGSVDTKVSEYALVGEGNSQRWIHTTTRKLHAHDVRTLALSPSLDLAAAVKGEKRQGNEVAHMLPILVSGGNDFSLVLTPASAPSALSLRGNDSRRKRGASNDVPAQQGEANPISTNPLTSFAETTQRRLSYMPATARGSALSGGGAVVSAAGRRWLALRRERSVGIWALPARAEVAAPVEEAAAQTEQQAWRKVLEMEMRCKSNLVALAISADGKWLAVGDLYETKLFALRAHGEGEELTLEPRRQRSLGAAIASGSGASQKGASAPGASALAFTPDSSRLVLASYPGSFLHIIELPAGANDECRLLQSFGQHRSGASSSSRATAGRVNGHAAADSDEESSSEDVAPSSSTKRSSFARIDLLAISGDSQYLLSVDSERRIHTFNLDVLSAHRTLPSPALVPSAAVFAPAQGRGAAHVALVLPSNNVLLYDVESARAVHAELNAALTPSIGRLRDHAIGASWLPTTPSQARTLVLWGATWLCTARLLDTTPITNGTTPKKRRSTTEEAPVATQEWSVKVTHRYQPLLFVDALQRAAGALSMDAAQGQQDEYCAELVVVERPFFALARSLPPAFKRAVKYGS